MLCWDHGISECLPQASHVSSIAAKASIISTFEERSRHLYFIWQKLIQSLYAHPGIFQHGELTLGDVILVSGEIGLRIYSDMTAKATCTSGALWSRASVLLYIAAASVRLAAEVCRASHKASASALL